MFVKFLLYLVLGLTHRVLPPSPQTHTLEPSVRHEKIVFIFLQFLLFIFVLCRFTLDPLRLQWLITHPTPTSTRYFAPEGLLLMIALYIAILVIELLRKRVLSAGIPTTVAFMLALVLGCVAKFGFATHDLF